MGEVEHAGVDERPQARMVAPELNNRGGRVGHDVHEALVGIGDAREQRRERLQEAISEAARSGAQLDEIDRLGRVQRGRDVAPEAEHDARVRPGDDRGRGDPLRHAAATPGSDPLVTVERALQPPDHRLRQGHGRFQDVHWRGLDVGGRRLLIWHGLSLF